MKTPHSIKSDKYPEFLRTNAIFKVYSTPEKIFPKIGLNNGKCALPSSFSMTSANHFFNLIVKEVAKSKIYARSYCHQASDGYYDKLINLLKDKSKCISIKNNMISFIVPSEYKITVPNSTETTFKSGDDLFSLIEKLRGGYGGTHLLGGLETLATKYLRIPKDTTIVFSSSGNKGFWDIATMSMRGISSCQRWTSKHHKTKLLGSMLDPYAGIIYLETNGKTKYGSRMIRRSIVRFVMNKETNKPALLLERVYPVDYEWGHIDHSTIELFKDFLRKKTKNKFDVICASTDNVLKYVVPFSDQTLDIYNTLGKKYLSYRDSGIKYSHIKSFKHIDKVKI